MKCCPGLTCAEQVRRHFEHLEEGMKSSKQEDSNDEVECPGATEYLFVGDDDLTLKSRFALGFGYVVNLAPAAVVEDLRKRDLDLTPDLRALVAGVVPLFVSPWTN